MIFRGQSALRYPKDERAVHGGEQDVPLRVFREPGGDGDAQTAHFQLVVKPLLDAVLFVRPDQMIRKPLGGFLAHARQLLYQSLRALANVHIPNRLVRCIFELRTIVIEGEGPQLGECVLCGNEAGERLFSVRKGGLVCRQCEGKVGDARPLLGSTVYAMQYIAATPLEKLYTFVVKEEVLEELEQVTGAYLEAYVGRHFKSLDILETVIGTD